MNANTEYEIKAMAFRIMTGLDAPGKVGAYDFRARERQEEWNGWIEDYDTCIRAILMAVDDRLKLEKSLSANTKVSGS
jgi:hypothetical protein